MCIFLIISVLPAVSSINTNNSNQLYLESKKYLSSKYLVMIDPLFPLDPNCASLKPIPIDTPDEFSWKNYKGKDRTASGEIGTEYGYIFVSTDSNELDVFYYVSWGDGDTEEWIGPYASSEEVTVKHT